jgi:hypothetical protein
MASQESDLREQLDRLETLGNEWLRGISHSNQTSNSVSNSNFYIQAGGVLMIVLLLAASFVLGVALDTSYSLHASMSQIQQRQDRQDDYLQAIYQQAPQLKPKETKQ